MCSLLRKKNMKLPKWLRTKRQEKVDRLWIYLTYCDTEATKSLQYKENVLSAQDVMNRFQELYDFLGVNRTEWKTVNPKLIKKSK